MIDRYSHFNHITYLLKFSCLSTFAKKFNSKITEKYGDPLKIKVTEKYISKAGENKEIEVSNNFKLLTYPEQKKLLKPKKFNWKDRHFSKPIEENVFSPMTKINWRTRRNLTNVCAICGTEKDVEMHHIRHIRKGKIIGFSQILKQINRTTIPLCQTHHREVHQRKYDGIKLNELFGMERFLF